MIDGGKHNVVGILVNEIDYDAALQKIHSAAKLGEPLAVSPAATHAVMTGAFDEEQRYRLNHIDLLVPDGQPVRHALSFLYGRKLPDRVYGPNLMLNTSELAAMEGFPIFLYGSTPEVLSKLVESLSDRFPGINIAGSEPSAFRTLSPVEREALVGRIKGSGARIVFVGLGCPRQETWIYEYRDQLRMPLIAAGAAFDFIAGTTPQAPEWMQRNSLEWLFRLVGDPRRLWKRYLGLGPVFILFVILQKLRLRKFSTAGSRPSRELSYG